MLKQPSVCVYGGSKEFRATIRKAAKWMIVELLGSRLATNITLRISFIKGLERREGFVGECYWTDQNLRPRYFSIPIDREQSRLQCLRTLAHELIHLKQFATGEMFSYASNENITRWRGRKIIDDDVAYNKQPWEREANRLEFDLVKAYQKAIQNQ